MIAFPNCKINLGLNIIRKRADGYHDLETAFYPIGLKDVLEVILAESFKYSSSGLAIDGDDADNLCVKAYHLLKKDFPHLPAVHIHLHKVIPTGAGLGGGSSDAAFMLKLLDKKFDLKLSQQQLLDYALQLGSDCPFFVYNKPCFAGGRGEQMEPLSLDLSAYRFVLINPQIHVSTGVAFSKLAPQVPAQSIKESITQPVEVWKDILVNDFEKVVFEMHPEIQSVRQKLYEAGALYASMSGSGSTVFGMYNKAQLSIPEFPENYKVYLL